MKRFFKILLPIVILTGAGLAIYYFSNRTAEIIVPDPTDEQPIDTAAPESKIGIDTEDIDLDLGVASVGKGGYRLEFIGTKMGSTVGRANIGFSNNGKEYEVKASARLAGILRQLNGDKMHLRATGKLTGEKMSVNYFYNASVADDKKATKKEKIHSLDGAWKYSKYGKERKVDAKVFDSAIDPLTLLFHIGRTIDKTGKCNLSHNGFMDDTGFTVTVTDKGPAAESGIKVAKKKIKEIRCDLAFKNRAGKVIKDYPFEHEFAKKSAKKRVNVISVYYSKLNGENFVPVFIKVRETPVGEVKIKLTGVKFD